VLSDEAELQINALATKLRADLRRLLVHGELTPAVLAERLRVDRTTVTRKLASENLTLRSIAELAWAADASLTFALEPQETTGTPPHPRFGVDPERGAVTISLAQKGGDNRIG
jgi:hypothetical protein